MVFFQFWSCQESRASGQSSQDVAAALDSLATVATLAAGFVMYNITTYNTAPWFATVLDEHACFLSAKTNHWQ